MARKKKAAPAGAPEWMVTFGDMMSLLLCFFVIIVSMSEVKEDKRFQKVTESIKRAFGYKTSVGVTPGDNVPTNSIEEELIDWVIKEVELNKGRSKEKGIEGDEPSVRMVREGVEYAIGGQLSFEAGKARLRDGARKELAMFSKLLEGLNTKIRVKGHASLKDPSFYKPKFESLDALSYARGLAVKNHLISLGIPEARITVEACGANEPIINQALTDVEHAQNRRVSIIVTENLVDEFRGQDTENKGDMING
jgi:chemotaxis protein MotB